MKYEDNLRRPGRVVYDFIEKDLKQAQYGCYSEVYPILYMKKVERVSNTKFYIIDLYDDDSFGEGYLKAIISRDPRTRDIFWFLYPVENGDSLNGPYMTFLDAAQSLDVIIAEMIDDINCIWDMVCEL
jgi:hypothetical protein